MKTMNKELKIEILDIINTTIQNVTYTCNPESSNMRMNIDELVKEKRPDLMSLSDEYSFRRTFYRNYDGPYDRHISIEKTGFTNLIKNVSQFLKDKSFKLISKTTKSDSYYKGVSFAFMYDDRLHVLNLRHSKSVSYSVSYSVWKNVYISLYEQNNEEVTVSDYHKKQVLEVYNSMTPKEKEVFKNEILNWLN